MKKFIFDYTEKNRFASVKKNLFFLEKEFGIKVSSSSILRVLQSYGLKALSLRKVPLISKINKIKRLELAEQFLLKPKCYWNRLICLDETKINFFCSDGKKWGWRFSGEQYSENTTLKTVKHGGGSIMLFGCMSNRGVAHNHRWENDWTFIC